jgi:hypothetical protein
MIYAPTHNEHFGGNYTPSRFWATSGNLRLGSVKNGFEFLIRKKRGAFRKIRKRRALFVPPGLRSRSLD